MIKCAMCGVPHREQQMVESSDDAQIEGLVCLPCDSKMVDAALASYGIDFDMLGGEVTL